MKNYYYVNKLLSFHSWGIFPLSFFVIFMAGCSNKLVNESSNLDFYSSTGNSDILFIADNQNALLLTEPIFEQSKLTEITVNTAHRKAALDEFSLDIIEYITKNNKSPILIHAGDILNNSCVEEFNQVKVTLDNSKRAWYIAPGNHDGYYLGISSPMLYEGKKKLIPLLNERRGWAQVCIPLLDRDSYLTKTDKLNFIMDKYSFTQSYITSLGILDENNRSEKINTIFKDIDIICKSAKGNNSLDKERNGFLKSICWTQKNNVKNELTNTYDEAKKKSLEEKPWRHFVVQVISIPFNGKQKNILIIDSANYKEGIAIQENGALFLRGFGAADNAYLSVDQLKIIKKLIKEVGSIDLVVGHHPLEDFKEESLENITDIIDKSNLKLYISGDTHDGFDVKHKAIKKGIFENSSFDIREANLGSTIDAPIEYANLNFLDNNSVYLDRKSLTPLTLEDNKTYKKSSYNGYPKNYATMDNIWNECKVLFHNGDLDTLKSYNPLGIESKYHWTQEYRINQPSSYLGIPYLFNISNTRITSLKAYKINRLLDLISVYRNLYIYSGYETYLDSDTNYIKKEEELKKNIMILKNYNFCSYFGKRYELFDDILKQQSYLIELLRSKKLDNTEAKHYKVCSALFEAEREVR